MTRRALCSGKASLEALEQDKGGVCDGFVEFRAVESVSDEIREASLGVVGC